ncbi:MAG: GNAT family N-acetyltransferase [Pseudobacter sp.]|uniref:GNAT family N-acetyltransferase n=1 Tax=Pseudobacter sp. TaxID=2045420 RepID=UPI003F7E3B44
MIFQRSIPILYSGNVEKSLTYYTEVLGFDCKWDWGNQDVMVAPKWQGKQIGTAMMNAIRNWLQENAPHNSLV